jgi:hypothetical protein
VDKIAIAKSLAKDLEGRLRTMEEIGALVSAAHLDAAIDSLCRTFDIPRTISDTE